MGGQAKSKAPAATPARDALPRARWAQVLSGKVEVLREMAASYWYCVYVWWRRAGNAPPEAAAATLASFTRWIEKEPPQADDPEAGLLREWMVARLGQPSTETSSEGEPAIEIDAAWAERRFAEEPEGEPEAVFQRRWALTILQFAMEAVRAEYGVREEEELFAEVSPFAGCEEDREEQYAAMALHLKMEVEASRQAVADFRARHRELLESFVGDTVADPADIDREIAVLQSSCDVPGASAEAAPLPEPVRDLKPEELFAGAANSAPTTSSGVSPWTPPSGEELAELFPQFEMLGMLGRGGMGAVYKARQVALDRLVALKLLPPEVSIDQDFTERFVREARAMAKLNHPNIVAVYDFGATSEGHLYFVMEFVEGVNLHALIQSSGKGISADQALVLTGQICTALAYAHSKGIVHRDIKPANVLVDTEGTAKVADFGLARQMSPCAEPSPPPASGTVIGTPEYMSPERQKGSAVDPRTDIFSVGVVLYEMLCKEPPRENLESPSCRVGCDARIDEIVMRAIHPDPEQRYPSTEEMITDLDAVRTAISPPPSAAEKSIPAREGV